MGSKRHQVTESNINNKTEVNCSTDLVIQLADESITAIYVADCETDELLYMNKTAKDVLHISGEILPGKKCYEFLMRRDIPCPFCHKSMFSEECFRENTIRFPFNGRQYRISSKIMEWSGRKVHIHYIYDITSLLDKEKELRTLTDHIPTGIGIYYVYPDGRLESEYLNDGYYEMMETTREKRLEYSGFSAFNAIHEEDLHRVKQEIADAMKQDRQIYCEMRMRKDDGTYKWVSIRAYIFEKTKEKAVLYCTYSDIDKIKEAQQEQIQRQHHYEEEIRLKTTVSSDVTVLAIGDLTDDVFLETPMVQSVLHEYFTGGSVNQVLENVCLEYIYPSEQEEYLRFFSRERMLSEYEKGVTHGSFRHQFKKINGWYESSFDLVLNPATGHIEVIAAIRNVTEIVRSEQVINTLMDIDYESIIVIDSETGEPSVLEASDLIHDVIEEQKIAEDNSIGVAVYLRKYCVDDDVEEVIRQTSLPFVKEKLKTEPIHTITYTLKFDENIVRKRAVYAFLDSSRRTIFCARQDITKSYQNEQKKNEELKEALLEAKEANQSKAEFFANMSHDMRTPLNGILGSVALAIDEEKHSPQMAEYLHDIQFSGDFLLNLINDILDLSKIENGAMELFPESYTYFEFIENMTKMITPLCRSKNITLNMNPLKENVAIKVDILRFQQIFFNIFSNAIKYTQEGGTVDHYTEVEPIDENHIDCRCHVIDNGIGMSEEFQKKLFEPYSREKNKVGAQGTGLGLSIAYELARMMGGELRVKSKLGKGTEMIIHTVLEVIPMPEDKPQEEKKNKVGYETLQGLHILLCEDHPLNAKITTKLLEKYGCIIDLAVNGELAVNIYAQSAFAYYDLIIMDIRMPVMNGLDAALAIRSLNREDAYEIPIIAMTANAYEEDKIKSKEAGMNVHLAKPIEPNVLYDTILQQIKK